MKGISRKEFIRLSLLSSLSIPFAGLNSCKSPKEDKVEDVSTESPPRFIDNLGLQVFAVRDNLITDADSIFKELSEIGIKSIELFDPATLMNYVPIIRNYGMEAHCCHFLPGYISGKWETAQSIGMAPPENYIFDNVLEDCNAAGIKYLGIAIMMPEERQTLEDYKHFADQVNLAAEKSKAAGIQLYYHNHSFEFKPEGSTTPMQEMLNVFDPDLVKIELDAFWVTISGNDPIEWMDKLGNQLLFIHLKDLKKGTPLDYTVFEVAPDAFMELGTGSLDFHSILTKARSLGVEYAFIDQDHSQVDMIESIRRNYEYVKSLGI